ncbi:MAG: ChbG/HpnK family deacetylase, partial [Phaeodactylibacter sp.]|nr:ChbG/HpnK family deacetylase [Phaeodactylibacter sp.]
TAEEVEKELRAQIEQTLRFGIRPTHLDSHMGCLFWGRPEYFKIYLKLGREYGIPVMLTKDPPLMTEYLTDDDMVLDHVYTANVNNYQEGMANYYEKLLKELPAGVSALLIHCAYDNLEFQGIAVDHPAWGNAWRQADFDFFTSEKCRKILEEENIRLVTWRELGARWREKRLKEKIGQMLLYGFRGMSTDENSSIIRHIEEGRVGNVIFFDYDVKNQEFRRNIESPEQVKALVDSLQAHASIPLLVAIDQEGGRVLRLKPKYGFPNIPSARHLGVLNNLDSTRYYAELNAHNMASLGINLNFAPVADLNIETESGVIGRLERSFSDDPEIVTEQAQAVIDAHLANGVIPVLKHFPGHGSARNDSHKGLTDVTETWSEKELEPYRRIIGQGYQGAVMTAHVFNQKIDEKYPATLSAKAISILRDSIGYEGVIFSDDMQMEAIASEYGLEEAIVLCINAGVDVLCFGNNLGYDESIPEQFQAIVLKAVEEGKISPERIDEAYERVMRLKGRLGK